MMNQRKLSRANWWYCQMHEVVDKAINWQPNEPNAQPDTENPANVAKREPNHTFVATPDNGKCSSCGKFKHDSIHEVSVLPTVQ